MRDFRRIPVVRGKHWLGHRFEFRQDGAGWLRRIAREHPEVSRARMGGIDLIVVSEPELVQQILVDQADCFEKTAGLKVFAAPVLGEGLLRLEGEAHRARRRLIAPVFMPKRVASYAHDMVSQAERAALRMEQLGEVDLAEETMRVTLGIVAKTLFDAEVSSDAEQISAAVTDAMRCMIRSLTAFVPLPPKVPTPTNLRMRAAVRRLDEIMYRIIRERRARAAASDSRDLLGLLLTLRDAADRSALTDKDVRDEAMTLFLAGHETTGTALAWTLELLAMHPAVRDQVESEIDAALAAQALTVASIPHLTYTQQALKEALRMRPPAYEITRRACREVTVGGYVAPAGTWFLINVIGMHHRPDLFSSPDLFMPERFSPERERALPRHAFLPFGAGARVCIGSHFAMLEATLVLAAWMHRLRFEPRYVGPTALAPLLTLRPASRMHVGVVPRRGSA